MKVRDIYNFIDSQVAFAESEPWDNSGLLVGDEDAEVKKIAVVLDVTISVMEQAIAQGIDLIVSHHPLIFRPKKNFLADSIEYQLAINGISVISAHTCFDSAVGGVNDILCEKLGIENVSVIETDETVRPLLRCGFVEETTGEDFAEMINEILGGKVFLADSGNVIKTVAVCTGSGGDFIGEVIRCGIDAYITGEASYHMMLDAKESGLTVITAGHYETEKPAMEEMKNRISEKFCDIEIVEIIENSPLV